MSSVGSILFETSCVNRDNIVSFLDEIPGCWKSGSLLWMRSNGFPVLPGLILNAWTRETEAAVSHFCGENKFSELLVRIEKPRERWTRRRGGYTVPVGSIQRLVEVLASEGMITILLEPASPYSDLYSLTSVCELHTGKVDIEVVGPGFDASDVLRADSSPHERFEFFLGTREQKTSVPGPLRAKRVDVVGSDDYRHSVRRRLVKIGARLRNPAFLEQELPKDESGLHADQLAQEAMLYLERTGQKLLLDHLTEYEPIPSVLLEEYVAQLQRLFRALIQSHVPWKELSVAGSFLDPSRLVLWDFFSPGSQDTKLLAGVIAT
jgi:hypothetical protein